LHAFLVSFIIGTCRSS